MSLKRDPRALPHPCAPACRRRGAASHTPPRLVSDTPPPPGVYTAFVARRRRRRCGREEISARRPREPQPRAPLRADPPFAAATLAAAQPAAVHAPQPHPSLPSPGNRYRHGLFTELPPPGARADVIINNMAKSSTSPKPGSPTSMTITKNGKK